jgi:hypothetical protein
MALWTVHIKEPRDDDIRLVRDGFRFWALLFPLPWLLIKGLWTAFLLAFAAQILITALCLWLAMGVMTTLIANFVVHLIVAVEASTITRWTLARRGWREVGAVSGDRLADAEYRYYSAHPPASAPVHHAAPALSRGPLPTAAPDALGLFGRS